MRTVCERLIRQMGRMIAQRSTDWNFSVLRLQITIDSTATMDLFGENMS